jgi:tripartite ATP-independent transporter DctP family solute receptor
MMKKGWLGIVLACSFFLVALSFGADKALAYTGEGQKALILKSGSEDPDNAAMGIAGIRFAERIKKATNGKIQITHYAGSQLGSSRQMIESVKVGALAFMISGMGGWNLILDTSVLPYLFRDLDHADKVINGPLWEEQNKRLVEKSGIRTAGWVFRGLRNCTFSKVAVHKPADMIGLKLRVPESAVNMETWRAVGAKPTPMAIAEVYTSLQQGAIDGQENPTDFIVKSSFFEVQKYLVLTGHVNPPGWVQLSDKVWQDLTPETKKVWMEVWNGVSMELRKEMLAKETENQGIWKAKGGQVIVPDVAAFRDAMKDVWKKFAPKAWGEGFYERIQAVR